MIFSYREGFSNCNFIGVYFKNVFILKSIKLLFVLILFDNFDVLILKIK
jgi:hypothetical protein